MTVQTQGFTTQGVSPGQQGLFGAGFPATPGAGQMLGVQQPYGAHSPYGQPSPYGYQQWPQTQVPSGAQEPSAGTQQVIQQLAQIIATAQQIIVPQAAGLAVQQVCQQLPQLIAQLAMQQYPGQQFGGQQFGGQQFGGQQFGGQQFGGQPGWPWAQPMGTMPGQAGRPYSFLS